MLSKTGLVADQEAHPDAHKSVNEINTQRLLKATLLAVFTGKKVTFEKMKERTDIRRRVVAAGDLCEKVHDHHLFKTWMVISVLASGIIVLLATYPDINKDPRVGPLKQSIEVFTLVAFTFEFVITITMFKTGVLCIRMAQSQQRANYLCVISRYSVAPWRYFSVPINRFDFLMLLGSSRILPGGRQFWSLLRLTRLLLILKLAKKVRKKKVVCKLAKKCLL